MEKNDAIKQLDEISQVIETSNRAFFSSQQMIVGGIIILFIPLIEFATKYFTFGLTYSANPDYNETIITLIHIVFYIVLFTVARRIVTSVTKQRTKDETPHPLIRKAFLLLRPIEVALFGSLIMLMLIGQPQLSFPIVYLFLGVLFNLYGRFTLRAINLISWSYIILGLVYLYLTQFDIPYLWAAFVVYLGISYLIMGIALMKHRVATKQ